MVVASIADFGVEGAADLDRISPQIVIITCCDGSAVRGYFPYAAKVIFRVVVEASVRSADSLFALGEVAFGDGVGCGIAFFGGLVAAWPEVAIVAGDGNARVAFGDAGSSAEAVVLEGAAAVVRVGDFHEAVFGVPEVGLACAVCRRVAVQIIAWRAVLSGDVHRIGLCLCIRVRAVVFCLDRDRVLAGSGWNPCGEFPVDVRLRVGERVVVRFHFHARAFVGDSAHSHGAAGLLGGELVAVVKSALGNLRAVLLTGDVAAFVEAEGLLADHRAAF